MNDRGRLTFIRSGALVRPEPDEIEAEKVASLLVESGVNTVVINACRSGPGCNEASNIANLLVQTGVKVAIGMSFNVLSLSAERFMGYFYHHLLAQLASSIEAVAYARGQLRRSSARMSKYHTKVNLEDHLVPVIHCQESELSNFHQHLSEQATEEVSRDVHSIPSNLLGREGDILRLEWMVTQFPRNRVHVQGHPGIGKTAFLKEAITWWKKTGLFQQVIYIQLAAPLFQNCTTEILLRSIAQQSGIATENSTTDRLIAALNNGSYLLVLDSLDSIGWSSSSPYSIHEHQLWMCLKKLTSCSIIISSRITDLWLGSAVQSKILLESLDFSSAVTVATGILQKVILIPKLLATQNDQSYLEQLITMSQGNPLAIKIMMYDLAKHFEEDPSTTLESHLISILQLRPVFIDVENVSSMGGARAIGELLEWVHDDTMTDSELYSHDDIPLQTHQPSIPPENGLESLGHLIGTIRQSNGHPPNPIIGRCRQARKLPKSGFYSSMFFNGFWHNIIQQMESFVTTLAALIVARRFLNIDTFLTFRTRLCEYSAETMQDSKYVYNILGGTSASGLPPEVAHHCLCAATKALAKVNQILSEDLCHFVTGPAEQEFGTSMHHFSGSYYSVSPLVSLVSQSSIVKALYPESTAHDVEIARDSLYRHRISVWLNNNAHFSSSPYFDALKMEFDFDFYNYSCLMLSHQQLDSWPTTTQWHFQYMIFYAAASDPRRLRVVERVLNRFIGRAIQRIHRIRQKYWDPSGCGYQIGLQDENQEDWSLVSELEGACVNALLRAITCTDLLRKPFSNYSSQWDYVRTCPMFPHWKNMNSDLRESLSKTLLLNTQWLEAYRNDGKFLNVTAGKELLDGMTKLNILQRKFLGLGQPLDTTETSPLNVPAQSLEKTMSSIGGQGLTSNNADRIISRLGAGGGRVYIETQTRAAEDLEKLLMEEIEHKNNVPARLKLHTYLASVYSGLGNNAIAVQHRTIREELVTMMEPEDVEQLEKSDRLWTTYWRDSHRLSWGPVNEAQRLERQLIESRAELSTAEAGNPPDELSILSCVEAIADTLRDLSRDAEAAEHYKRVIQGRQRLLPANDREILSAIFERSKLLGSLSYSDESIQDLRMLQKEFAELGDREAHNNIRGTLGLEILRFVQQSKASLPETAQDALLLEAKELLEASVKTAEEIFQPGDFNISACFSNLASLHAYQENYEEAEIHWKAAIRVHLSRTSNDVDPGLIKAQNCLACLWNDMHKFNEAEDLYNRLLEICINHYEMWHQLTLLIMLNLCDLYNKTGPSEKARTFVRNYVSRFRQSLEDFVLTNEQDLLNVNQAKYQLRLSLAICDSYDEAILLLEEVAVAWRKQEKRDDEVAELLAKLRRCYNAHQPPRLEQGYEINAELIALRSDLNGPWHLETLNAIDVQVVCLRRMNRIEEAVDMQLPLIEARKATQAVSHEYTMNNLSYLAELYEEMEDWSAALEIHQELYQARKALNPTSPKTLHKASRIARMYENLLDWDRVVEFRSNEVETWRKIEGSNSKNTLSALHELAFGLEKLGRYDKAKTIITEALDGQSKLLGPTHFETLESQRIKAIICRGMKYFDESENLLNSILATRTQHPAGDSARYLALIELSKLSKALDQPDRAIELLREALTVCEESESIMRFMPDIAKEYTALHRWEEAEKLLDEALLKLRSRQPTRAVLRKIEECVSLLEDIKKQIESGAAEE